MPHRRLLRRYLALVHHAETLLEASVGEVTVPVPAEAVVVIEDLVVRMKPAVGRMQTRSPEPADIRAELAGWVH